MTRVEKLIAASVLLTTAFLLALVSSALVVRADDPQTWAVIRDQNGSTMTVWTTSGSIYATLCDLYANGTSLWVGGTVEAYNDSWGFRFGPGTIFVAEVTAEIMQSTITLISGHLGDWLGHTACVWASVIQVSQSGGGGGGGGHPLKD